MKRRDFLAGTCFASVASLTAADDATGKSKKAKEYFELRSYLLDSEAQKEKLTGFLRDVAIPAWNRIGIGPVGVFSALEGEARNVYVLLPHKSVESAVTATAQLLADEEYLKSGAALLDAPKSEPAYRRMESSLLVAFEDCPKLEVPSKKELRIFQLRTYESHSVKKGQRKIEMFNDGGEIALFRRVGLNPVFFGEALVGSRLPNLTYMLGFDDKEASEAAWAKFLADPEWLKLKADPKYKDTVSNITNTFLRPEPGSQI